MVKTIKFIYVFYYLLKILNIIKILKENKSGAELKMQDIDQRFIELYEDIGRSQGLDSSLTKLFAIIYIEPEEISMNDLSKRTGYSLATISNKAKVLESMSIVRRVTKPGTKQVFLYAEKNFFKILKGTLVRKQEYIINVVKDTLPSIISEGKGKAKTGKDRKKMKILESYYRQILDFEKVIENMLRDLEEVEKKRK